MGKKLIEITFEKASGLVACIPLDATVWADKLTIITVYKCDSCPFYHPHKDMFHIFPN